MAGERGPREEALSRLRDNAFHVLELPITASRHDVERQGQKLLGMLELGLSSAARYPTPVGTSERDADKVRVALARLRDPDKRLEEELWGRLPAVGAPSPVKDPGSAGGGDASRVKDPTAAGDDDASRVKDPGSEGGDDPLHVKDPTGAGDDDASQVKDPGGAGVDDAHLDDPEMLDLPRAPRGPRADRPWAEALAAFGWSRR